MNTKKFYVKKPTKMGETTRLNLVQIFHSVGFSLENINHPKKKVIRLYMKLLNDEKFLDYNSCTIMNVGSYQ